MADQKIIQELAEQLSTKFGLVQKEVVDSMLKMTKGKSKEEALAIINELNITAVGDIKTANIKSAFKASAIELLKKKKMFAQISEATLQTLLTQSEQYLAAEIVGMSNTMKQQIVAGIMNNRTTEEIVEAIGKKGYGAGVGMKRIVGDGLNNYSRAVGRMMMEEAEDNTRYVYIGPADEKTRSFCLSAIQAGPVTLKEIESMGGEWKASLTEGGGLNCRHNWEIASTDTRSQFHRPEEAEKLIDNVR